MEERLEITSVQFVWKIKLIQSQHVRTIFILTVSSSGKKDSGLTVPTVKPKIFKISPSLAINATSSN